MVRSARIPGDHMSEQAAVAFLERLEGDEEFAKELRSVREDPDAVGERVHAAGFDATPGEIREAFIERYGSELTQEQLDQIAAGADAGLIAGETVGSVRVVGALGGVAAAAAA